MSASLCHITSVHPADDVRILYKECHSLAKQYDTHSIAPNVDDSLSERVCLPFVTLAQTADATGGMCYERHFPQPFETITTFRKQITYGI